MQTKIYFVFKRGSPGEPDRKEPRSESRKFECVWKDKKEACRESRKSGCHGPPGSCLEAASEGALETPLQVQHLQEELNTRLPGQLC